MGYQDEDDIKRKLGISQGQGGGCTSCSGNNSSGGGYPPPSREGTPGFQNYDVPRNLGIQVISYYICLY